MMNKRLAALLTLLLLLLPGRLFAHANLRKSDPAAGARVSGAPRNITLEFTETPELAFTTVTLTRPDGSFVQLGAPTPSPSGITVAIESPLAPGKYRVSWKTAASDGHPTHGSFEFVILPGAEGLSSASTTAMTDSGVATGVQSTQHRMNGDQAADMTADESLATESPAYVIIRWVDLAGVVVLIGAVAFRRFVVRRLTGSRSDEADLIPGTSRSAAHWGALAAAALLITAGARLAAETYAMHGAAGALDPVLLGRMIVGTKWGLTWLFRLGATLLALLGFYKAERRVGGHGWVLAEVAVLLVALTLALGGHAASSPRLSSVAIVADTAHVLGAGGWLGSLFLVVVAGIPAVLRLQEGSRGEVAAEMINAFSPAALASSAVIVATGVFAGWLHVASFAALRASSYGQALLIKVALFSLVALVGAYHWRRSKPRLGDPRAAESLRKTAGLELFGGLLVILVTAILVALPTPVNLGP
jgi:putative copper export protein/methionine-rich copper-binding protein CopC